MSTRPNLRLTKTGDASRKRFDLRSPEERHLDLANFEPELETQNPSLWRVRGCSGV